MTAPGAEAVMENESVAGARTGFLAPLWLLATGALCWLVLSQPQQQWAPPPQAPVALGEEHYRLGPQELEWLRAFSLLHFGDREAGRELLAKELDAGLEEVFAGVRARLPEFADWYYSLGGEYTRLSMAALARLNLAEDSFVAGKAAEMLFPAETWEQDLDGLDGRALAHLQGHQRQLRDGWLAELSGRLAPYRVPAPLDPAGQSAAAQLRIDDLGTQLVVREREALESRVALSSAAAGGVAAGTIVWRGAAARGATASGRAAAARGVGRGAARAGAAAGGGAAACGPAALGCALLAGAAAWVATDWALLRLDEALNRDELLAALDASLAGLKAEMHADLLHAYQAVLDRYHDGVEVEIASAFSPARAGRGVSAAGQ
jgi:hypothetical protein